MENIKSITHSDWKLSSKAGVLHLIESLPGELEGFATILNDHNAKRLSVSIELTNPTTVEMEANNAN